MRYLHFFWLMESDSFKEIDEWEFYEYIKNYEILREVIHPPFFLSFFFNMDGYISISREEKSNRIVSIAYRHRVSSSIFIPI